MRLDDLITIEANEGALGKADAEAGIIKDEARAVVTREERTYSKRRTATAPRHSSATRSWPSAATTPRVSVSRHAREVAVEGEGVSSAPPRPAASPVWSSRSTWWTSQRWRFVTGARLRTSASSCRFPTRE